MQLKTIELNIFDLCLRIKKCRKYKIKAGYTEYTIPQMITIENDLSFL